MAPGQAPLLPGTGLDQGGGARVIWYGPGAFFTWLITCAILAVVLLLVFIILASTEVVVYGAVPTGPRAVAIPLRL